MIEADTTNLESGSKEIPTRGPGCANWAVFAITAVIVAAFGATAAGVTWLLDEMTFEGVFHPPAALRVLESGGFALIITVPLAILAWQWRAPLFRAIYRTWAFAGAFGCLMAISRLPQISHTLYSQVIQLGVMLVAGLAWLLWKHRKGGQGQVTRTPNSGAVWLAVGIGAILAIPWLAWGAAGSPLDILVALADGLAFGVFAAFLLSESLFRPFQSMSNKPGERFWLAGLSAALALFILAEGLQATGLAWYLLLPIPGVGLAAYCLFLAGGTQPRNTRFLPNAILIGLTAAVPLIFVDQSEMSMLISSGTGELQEWISRAAFVGLALALTAGLVMFLAWRLIDGKSRILFPILAGAAGLLALILFVVFGRPGFYGDRLFVVMQDQADVSKASAMPDYNQRRTFVYQTLAAVADASQAGLRAKLDSMRVAYKPYYLVNGIEVQGGPFLRLWLQAQPGVGRVLDAPMLRPLPAAIPASHGDQKAPQGVLWNQSMLGADRVWKELGVTGKGIVVGQSDSGVQGDHPELASGYRGAASGSDYNWLDPWFNSPAPVDIGGHGTHTLGTILGKSTGIAPGATWFGCVNLARNLGNPGYYLNCMQFMLAPYPTHGDPFKDGDPTRSANVINDSWGCPDVEGCDAASLQPAVDALRDAGIFVVASAGNNGLTGCGTVTDPLAIYASAFTVGAVDSKGVLAPFSSIGPVKVDGSGRTKPDVVAPGVDVLSAFPGNSYQMESGTSMAGPHVVGVVALMWSANPVLIGNIDQTEQILDATAKPYHGAEPGCVDAKQTPNDGTGYGLVDAYAAVKAAMQYKK